MTWIRVNMTAAADLAVKRFMLRRNLIRKSDAINIILEESDLIGILKNKV